MAGYEATLLNHKITITESHESYEISVTGPLADACSIRKCRGLAEAKAQGHAFAHSMLQTPCTCKKSLHWTRRD